MRITKHKLSRLWNEPGSSIRDWLLVRYPLAPRLAAIGAHAGTNIAHVAVGDAGERVYQALLSAVRAAGAHFVEGGFDPWAKGLHFTEEDGAKFLEALEALTEMSEDKFIVLAPGSSGSLDKAVNSGAKIRHIQIRPIERAASGPSGALAACSLIEVCFWRLETDYAGLNVYTAPIRGIAANRVRAATFEAMLGSSASLDDAAAAALQRVRFPIDAVYTWVDDTDENWLAQKAAYAGALDKEVAAKHRSNHGERFRNRDELRYSLRSLEMFAPFIRRVFLVTNGQAPAWLNTGCERLTVINHAEIFAEGANLPTFNSSAIETQLHHIHGLAEHFLYFNDDFFLGEFCLPEDFFFANGATRFFPSSQSILVRDIDADREAYLVADANALGLLGHHPFERPANTMLHAPYPSKRSLLFELERRFPEAFAACASERFRSAKDIRPIAFMQYYAGFEDRLSFPATISNAYLPLWRPTVESSMRELLRNRKCKTICLNDVGVQDKVNTDRIVAEFLQAYFPFPSKFEND